jgi:hypothetical protein
MAVKSKNEPQNPLMLRCHRLMDAFAKSNDERDFFLDRNEGFILYIDLDKSETEIQNLEKELEKNRERYVLIPKLTFYETKKIMEGFVNEKVYDIDTKEKLLDIIQSKEARENFLEFIYDHHSEYEKWQQFYQERSRIRIIEWLRQNNFYFVFEEDLELSRKLIEGLKRQLFQAKVSKDIAAARKVLITKAKTYYSSEALNPRPKRGRPPKQAVKTEVEPQITSDIYTTVPPSALPFLYTPDITSLSAITFSAKFETEEDLLSSKRHHAKNEGEISIESFNEKLASLRSLSSRWLPQQPPQQAAEKPESSKGAKSVAKYLRNDDVDEDEIDEDEIDDFSYDHDDDEDDEDYEEYKPTVKSKSPSKPTKIVPQKTPKVAAKPVIPKKAVPVVTAKAVKPPVKKAAAKPAPKKPVPKKVVKAPPKKAPTKKVELKKAPPKKFDMRKAPPKSKSAPAKKPVGRR